jgi:hypothetical protein
MHVSDTLFINDMPYKSLFNGLFNAIFLESFVSFCGDDHLNLLKTILHYLETLHFFGTPDMVFPHLYNSILLVALNVLIYDDPKQI